MTDEPVVTKKSESKAFNWLLGCGIAIVVVGVLCAGGSWVAFQWGKQKMIDFVYESASAVIEETQLPQPQIDSMMVDLNRLKEAAEDGNIEWDKLEGLEDDIARVGALGGMRLYEIHVIEKTEGITEEERDDARRQVQRLARGIHEGDISVRELQGLDVRFDKDDREGGYDPEDLKRDIAKVRRIVDAAKIVDEPFDVDVAGRFRDLVDDVIE